MTVCSLLQNYKWCQLHLKPDLLLEEGWTVLKVTFQQGFHRIIRLLAFLVSVNNQLQEREREKKLQTPLLLLLTPTETESYATPACLFQTCATTSATTRGCVTTRWMESSCATAGMVTQGSTVRRKTWVSAAHHCPHWQALVLPHIRVVTC